MQDEPVSEPKPMAKPFEVPKRIIWSAYQKVKRNGGAAGVDGETIAEFEQELKGNLYRIWNRMSSGTYFPPPVRAVEIPKRAGARLLGVPTVADRIAQTAVAMCLEPTVEPQFHADSFGYRPGRSALDAVALCRQRCWRYDWVVDFDIRSFFDNIDHDLLLKAVSKHTDKRWILLYVRRWLCAPLQHEDGTMMVRDRGTPQGSAISPLLANLFLHYAFDRWMDRNHPDCPFERYADDGIVHCRSRTKAEEVLAHLAHRMSEVGLDLHPDKTRIVYCKDANRAGSHDHERFDFLGYTFGARRALGPYGVFVSFAPAISRAAECGIKAEIKRWRLHLRSGSSLADLAAEINPVVRGWIAYYGRFHTSRLARALQALNLYLRRWARRKYRKLRHAQGRAAHWLRAVSRRQPTLFAHWSLATALP
jgi:group II intron reverse transcriptase/maturase